MEQILIRSLPAGTKAAIVRWQGSISGQSRQARAIIAEALEREPMILTIFEAWMGADIDFEPQPLR